MESPTLKKDFLQEEESSFPYLLAGKRALVTGGTSGLGQEIAKVFVSQGASVAIFGRNPKRAEETLQHLETRLCFPDQQKVWAETLDVAKTREVDESLLRLLDLWGGIDIVVNSAGITRDSLFIKMTEEKWDEVIETNLKSVYNVCRGVSRPMIKNRSGKIINIASIVGLTGNAGQVNYAASKMGIIGLTKSLAKELAPRGICVNCIAPGFFITPMTDQLSETQKEAILQKIPMKRFGRSFELAQVALFLASSWSDYVTGQTLTVDGGMIA